MPRAVGHSWVLPWVLGMDIDPATTCQPMDPPVWELAAASRCPHRALPAHCWLSTYVAVACWHPSLPWHRAIPGTTRSPVPFRHGTPLATSLRLQHSRLLKAKFPPSGPAGSGSSSVPTSSKSKEPLVSSSVSQYFTELCFPYLVQLKSQGEVLYKSKFF